MTKVSTSGQLPWLRTLLPCRCRCGDFPWVLGLRVRGFGFIGFRVQGLGFGACWVSG